MGAYPHGPPAHDLFPRHRSHRHFAGADPGALVRDHVPAGLPHRVVAGADAHPGRPPAWRGSQRFFRPAVLFDARRGGRRPRRLHAVLRAVRTAGQSAVAVQGLGRRHELPRRPAGRAGRGLVVVAQARPALLRHRRFRRAAGAAWPDVRPLRQLHRRRAVGQVHRVRLGRDLPQRAARAAAQHRHGHAARAVRGRRAGPLCAPSLAAV
jgi:hypothetical protein